MLKAPSILVETFHHIFIKESPCQSRLGEHGNAIGHVVPAVWFMDWPRTCGYEVHSHHNSLVFLHSRERLVVFSRYPLVRHASDTFGGGDTERWNDLRLIGMQGKPLEKEPYQISTSYLQRTVQSSASHMVENSG